MARATRPAPCPSMASRPRRDIRPPRRVGQQSSADGGRGARPHASVPTPAARDPGATARPARTKRRTVVAWPGTTATATAGVPSAHAS